MRQEAPRVTQSEFETSPGFLTAKEVAERLRVSKSTVYNLISCGRLPAHRNGRGAVRPRGVRVAESAVRAYLDQSLIAPSEVA